jgi:hypothetical protein
VLAPYSIPANTSVTLAENFFLGQLPPSKSTVYTIYLRVVGVLADGTPALDISGNFQTQ